MALYPYVATLAVDPVTLVKAAGATGVIYAPEDTGFASPLTATDATGNPIPLTANADGILPSFYSTSPAVNWRSGSYTFPLVTSQPLPGPEGAPGQPGSDGQDGMPGRDGSNVVPTDQAVSDAITTPGTPANIALSATFARVEETHVNFAQVQGVDRTGVDSSLPALQALMDAATVDNPLHIHFPQGKYYWSGPFPTIDPRRHRFTGDGANHVTWAFSGSFTGTAITIVAPVPAPRRATIPISGINISGPTLAGNTADCIVLGGTSAGPEASLVTIVDVTITGFRNQVTFRHGAYIITFRDCSFTQWTGNSVWAPAGNTGAGEGFKFDNCTFHQGKGVAIRSDLAVAQWVFISCHIDYNAWDIELNNGSMAFLACYFEATNNEATTPERIRINYTDASNPQLTIHQSVIFPLWTSAGPVQTFIRITGAPPANITWNPSVSITDTKVHTASTSNIRYLIRDDHTPPTSGTGPKFARVSVRNLNYNDQGGAIGAYNPLIYRDVDGKEWQLVPGDEMVPRRSSRKADWTGTESHVFETMPRILAADKKVVATNTLYLVRLPQTWLQSFRAGAYKMSAAIGTVASSNAYCYMALYTSDGPVTNGPLRLLNKSGITVTADANSIKSVTVSQTLALHPDLTYYLGIQVGGATATPPELWGINSPLSPLMKKGTGSAPFLAGAIGATTVPPDTITDYGSIGAADFIPWLSIEPVTYAT